METYKTTDWQGTDADLEISLLEYGCICRQLENRSYPDEYQVLHRYHEGYDIGYFRDSDFNDLIEGKDWLSIEAANEFLEFTGMNKDEWKKLPFIHKFSDLTSYYSIENFNSTVCPWSEDTARVFCGLEN